MIDITIAALRAAILDALPADGGSIGNLRLRERIAEALGAKVNEADYFAARDALLAEGLLVTGRGRGGSVRRVLDETAALVLSAPEKPAGADAPAPKQASMTLAQARKAKAQAPAKGKAAGESARVLAYQHDNKRRNNPDVGVVTPETDPDQPRTTWAYDPHIDPALQIHPRLPDPADQWQDLGAGGQGRG